MVSSHHLLRALVFVCIDADKKDLRVSQILVPDPDSGIIVINRAIDEGLRTFRDYATCLYLDFLYFKVLFT